MKKMTALLTSILMIASGMGAFTVQAAHSYETAMTEELAEVYLSRENAYCVENNVFYSTQQGGEFEFEPLETAPGCFDRTPLLLALLQHDPNAQFGVQIECTYGTDLKAEIERLQEYGITASIDEKTGRLAAILTGEQLENYPAADNIGYQIGLAPSPSLEPEPELPRYGDANYDGVIDIMDVIYINKFLLGSCNLTEIQKECADCNRDGSIDDLDSLNILKYIVGVIDTFGYVEPDTDPVG